MKTLLLASTAAVAFAGAASATVELSGSAEAWINENAGTTWGSTVSLDFSASQELNNGWTASVTIGAEMDNWGSSTLTHGNIALTDGTTSIEAGDFDNGAAWGAVGDAMDFQSAGFSEVAFGGARVSTTIGGVGIAATYSTSGDVEVGATATLGSVGLTFGYDMTNFGLGLSTSVGGVDVAAQIYNGTAWGLALGYTVGSVELGFATGDTTGWAVSAGYSADPFSVGVTYYFDASWELTLGYAAGDLSAEVNLDSATNWDASVDYAAGAFTVGATINSANDMGVDVGYDLGNDMMAYAGMRQGTDAEMYAALEIDFGNGASGYVSYSDTGAGDANTTVDYAHEYMQGVTLGMAFDF